MCLVSLEPHKYTHAEQTSRILGELLLRPLKKQDLEKMSTFFLHLGDLKGEITVFQIYIAIFVVNL